MYTFINLFYYEIIDSILSEIPDADVSNYDKIEEYIMNDDELWNWAISKGVEI